MSDTSAKQRLDRFLAWATERGIVLNKAEIRYCGPDSGFGIYALDDLRANENVVKVPADEIITAVAVAKLPEYEALLTSFLPTLLDSFEILVLFFYTEFAKGPDSAWYPYLEMLPTSFTTPLATWPDLPTAQLPLETRAQFEKQVIEVDSMYRKLQGLVPGLEREAFLTAWHVVNTRCIFCENRWNDLVNQDNREANHIAIVPVMDFFNHDPDAHCLAGLDHVTRTYRVCVGERTTLDGDQLFVCYGQHDNARLWVEYGFTLPGNSFNRVRLPIELVVALLDKIGVEPSKAHVAAARESALPCTIYVTDEDLSYGLRRTLAILLLPPNQLAVWSKVLFAADADDIIMSPKVTQTGTLLLQEYRERLRARAAGIDPRLAWLWTTQVEVLSSVIKAVESVSISDDS